MPLITTVIDNTSPLILYDYTWTSGTSMDDTLASEYYLGTFTINNVTNGAATFNFNGTTFAIYGARRPNHGTYSVEVDQQGYADLDGTADNIFQTPIFNLSGLSQGMHTVTLTNTATKGLYVDIDMIMWQSEVGNENDQLTTEIVENTDPRFQYQGSAWSTSSNSFNLGLFSNGTGHVTETYEANVTFTFTGEAVTLYGTSGPLNGQYSVQLDGGQTMVYNASLGLTTSYGVIIYHADNLGPGSHQVVLSNLPRVNGETLSIDYAQLWTTVSQTTSPSSDSPSSSLPSSFSSNASTSQSMSSGSVVGIVILALSILIAAGTALLFYRRWKSALAQNRRVKRAISIDQSTFVPSDSASMRTVFRSGASAVWPHGTENSQENSRMAQYGGSSVPPSSGLRHSRSRSMSDISESSFLQLNPAVEEPESQVQVQDRTRTRRRRLPDPPGGPNLSDPYQFPHRSGLRRTSTAIICEPPPNYRHLIDEL